MLHFHIYIGILPETAEIITLAEQYFSMMDIPEKSRLDTIHLATAAWYKMDYIISWNMKHIVNPKIKRVYEKINIKNKIHTPMICTPEELLEQ